jgi:hypothetical protein
MEWEALQFTRSALPWFKMVVYAGVTAALLFDVLPVFAQSVQDYCQGIEKILNPDPNDPNHLSDGLSCNLVGGGSPRLSIVKGQGTFNIMGFLNNLGINYSASLSDPGCKADLESLAELGDIGPKLVDIPVVNDSQPSINI